jgi:hypothetical protein
MSGRYYYRPGRSTRYYRYRNGRYYGRRRYTSTISRARGNMRAAKQQADQATFTINVPTQISTFCFEDNVAGIDAVYGVRAVNIYDLLRKSEFYKNYANMYDEFKIDNIKVKLLPTEFKFTVVTGKDGGASSYRSVTVYTAWDRTGLNDNQLSLVTTTGDYDDDAIVNGPWAGTASKFIIGDRNSAGDQDGLYCVIGDDITTYSSAESRQINPNTNTSIVRWLRPKTIAEKSQWLSTSSLKEWYKTYNDDDGCYCDIPVWNIKGAADPTVLTPEIQQQLGAGGAKQGILTSDSPANSTNPCYLIEDPGIKFKPTLIVGVYPKAENEEDINIVKFNLETEVVCTFRGLRKSKVVAA